MLIERGNVIKIGCSAYNGQWYEIAKFMNYESDELIWVDGDITALDKHITDWMMYVYLAAGSRYFSFKRMNEDQKKFMKRLYTYIMYHVTNKITLQVGNIWRIICGVMYSGGPETSHGDSWIMGLCFCLYLCHIMHIHPHIAKYIMDAITIGMIRFIVYGDDHIWCYPKVLRGILGASSFAEFLRRYCNMELRDYKEYEKFLSVVDHSRGTFIFKGPRFLKRFFIFNDIILGGAPVLPWKQFLEPVVRMCTIERNTGFLGALLKTYGHAWESYGTNLVTYSCAKTMYDKIANSGCVKMPRDMIDDFLMMEGGEKAVNDLVRRIGLTAEEIFDKFPDLEELQQRHIYNPRLCDYRKHYLYDHVIAPVTVKKVEVNNH